MLRNRICGHMLAEDVIDTTTGEILAEAGTEVDRDLADKIQNAAVPYLWIQGEERKIKVISNLMVDLTSLCGRGSGRAWGYRISILSCS